MAGKKNIKPNLKEELEALKDLASQLENLYKKSLADYQNLEKRVSEERITWIKQANKDLVLKLLPVLDTLMLAREHVQDEGLALSIKQFLDILRNEGVEKISTEEAFFNPQIMEAVGTVEGEEGKVIKEVRIGFKFSDGAVLRPAQVMVGKETN